MGLETVRTSKAYTLSGGERRRLEIARSLTLQPSFILLDEPFSGIDPLTVKDLQEIIRDLAKRSEEHTSELQSLTNLVCRLLLEKKKKKKKTTNHNDLIIKQNT